MSVKNEEMQMASPRIEPGGSLVLRGVRDASDVARLVQMYAREQNPVESRTAASLLGGGRVRREEYLLVEDTSTGSIVSTTCLIPWTLRFGGVSLSCAQVEMVYTHPAWRNRGLVRRQFEELHGIAREAEYDILLIWGIPFYYRQFGYSYAVENCTTEALESAAVPAGSGGEVRLRPATLGDIPTLDSLYEGLASKLDVSIQRGEEHWRYMLETARQPVVVVEWEGRPAGYLLAASLGRSIRVLENGIPEKETALAVLRLLAKDHDQIVARWPRQAALAQLMRESGSAVRPNAQWLIRVPDLPALLTRLRPELDRRLEASDCSTLDARFLLNLYKEAVSIEIRAGRVASVGKAGPVNTSIGGSGADLSIPPDAFVKLLFGEAGIDELSRSWPDTIARDTARPLVEALFPRLAAHLSTPYHAYGPGFDGLDDGVRALYL
jgi:predicted N-acetyltransferase YhbS